MPYRRLSIPVARLPVHWSTQAGIDQNHSWVQGGFGLFRCRHRLILNPPCFGVAVPLMSHIQCIIVTRIHCIDRLLVECATIMSLLVYLLHPAPCPITGGHAMYLAMSFWICKHMLRMTGVVIMLDLSLVALQSLFMTRFTSKHVARGGSSRHWFMFS